jgi:hypothetical protein
VAPTDGHIDDSARPTIPPPPAPPVNPYQGPQGQGQ